MSLKTKTNRAEGAARSREASGESLLASLGSMGEGVITANSDGRISGLNAAAASLCGWTRDEAVGRPVESVLRLDRSESSEPLLATPAATALGGGSVAPHEAVLIAKDGTRCSIELSAAPIVDRQVVEGEESGGRARITGCMLICRDLTARRRAEQELRRSYRELADFFENASVPMHWVGPDATILRANKAELDLLGYAPEEYIGRKISEFHVDRVLIDDIIGRLTRGETLREYRSRMRCKDGSVKVVFINSSGFWEDGKFIHSRCITLDLTGRAEAAEALLASEERYRVLVESQSEMLCRFQPDGKILFVNGAYARTQGTTPEALIGGNFWSIIPQEHRANVRAMLDRLTPESPEISIENLVQTVRGERWVFWTNRALAFDAEGRVLEAQSAGIDITRRKQMEQALKESDRRKDEFLATLAHELRNPLAPIANSLEILKQAEDNRELQQQARGSIERQLSHLVRLVDDLLDVSRITRDKLELRKSQVELKPIVSHAVETCRALADREEQAIEIVLPEEPTYLEADPVRLAQVLNNLLNNACKYTDRGGTIRLVAKRLPGEVVISVRDTGIGMPPDKLERIFDMFAQVEDTGAQAAGGLGIGLTLVKRLVELHGGSIAARSEGLGRGSEFVMRLPILSGGLDERQSLEASGAPVTDRRRILIVDDNADNADSLALLLQMNGHETQVVYDGLAAVQAAERFRPDMVLLDLGLPVLDGIEVCRRIRERPWGENMAVVALTGRGQDEDRRKSREAGFDDHLIKPVAHSEIVELLAALS